MVNIQFYIKYSEIYWESILIWFMPKDILHISVYPFITGCSSHPYIDVFTDCLNIINCNQWRRTCVYSVIIKGN